MNGIATFVLFGLWRVLAGLAQLSPAETDQADRPVLPASVAGRSERTVVYQRPARGAPKRGTIAGGYRMPVFRAERGTGCTTWWFELHVDAWACGERVQATSFPPDAPELPELDEDTLTPFPYGFVKADGAPLYDRLADAEVDYVERWLEPGYAISVQRRSSWNGERFYQTAAGSFIRASDVYIARPSTFHGVPLQGREDVGWTFRDSTRKLESLPGAGSRDSAPMERQTFLRFAALHDVAGVGYLEVEGGGFVRASDVRRPDYTDPPAEVGPFDRWFDVDRENQVLVAYEGARPAYATLVSTGRRGYATPEGVHRIWAKLLSDRMANESPANPEEDPYYLEDVPWVAYFAGDFALHGAYWHRNFGNRKSHGCVNLSPLDADWVFDFARPALPRGWWSITPTESDPGSIVVVR